MKDIHITDGVVTFVDQVKQVRGQLGSTAAEAAADIIISVRRAEGGIELHVRKCREARCPEPVFIGLSDI